MPLAQEEIDEAAIIFKAADADGDGQITLEELKAYFTSQGEEWNENWETRFNQADKNSDGMLDWNEWLAAYEA